MSELSLEQVVDQHWSSDDTPTSDSTPTPALADSPLTASVTPSDVAPPVDSTPMPEAAPAASTALPELADDALVTVTVDGEPVQMAWKDAKRSISHTAASTKRFQQAAELRKEADAVRAQAQADLAKVAKVAAYYDAIRNDPQKLAAFYMAQQATRTPQQAAPAAAPLDMAAYSQQMLAQADTLVQQRLAEARQQEATTRIEADLTAYTDSLLSSHPILSTVPGFAANVYETVARMGPQSMDEAKEWIAAQVDEVKSKLSAQLGEVTKQAAVAKAKAVNGTERGGSPVLPSPATYASVDDPKREADMLAFLANLG